MKAAYYLRIFIHAHSTGNSVPPHVVKEAMDLCEKYVSCLSCTFLDTTGLSCHARSPSFNPNTVDKYKTCDEYHAKEKP